MCTPVGIYGDNSVLDGCVLLHQWRQRVRGGGGGGGCTPVGIYGDSSVLDGCGGLL